MSHGPYLIAQHLSQGWSKRGRNASSARQRQSRPRALSLPLAVLGSGPERWRLHMVSWDGDHAPRESCVVSPIPRDVVSGSREFVEGLEPDGGGEDFIVSFPSHAPVLGDRRALESQAIPTIAVGLGKVVRVLTNHRESWGGFDSSEWGFFESTWNLTWLPRVPSDTNLFLSRAPDRVLDLRTNVTRRTPEGRSLRGHGHLRGPAVSDHRRRRCLEASAVRRSFWALF